MKLNRLLTALTTLGARTGGASSLDASSPLAFIKPSRSTAATVTDAFTPLSRCIHGPSQPDLIKILERKGIDDENDFFYDPYRDFASYDCKYGRENPDAHLLKFNGKAVNDQSGKIWCRHLAPFVRDNWQERYEYKQFEPLQNPIPAGEGFEAIVTARPEPYHQQLASIESIQKQPTLRNNQYEHIDWEQVKTEIIFDPANIGNALTEVAAQLTPGQECNMLLLSSNHMMTVKVKHSDKGYYKVNFYDPNPTVVHQNYLYNSLDRLQGLQSIDLMQPRSLKLYELDKASDRATLVIFDDLLDKRLLLESSDLSPMDLYFFFGNCDRQNEEIEAFSNLLDHQSNHANFTNIVERPNVYAAIESRGIPALFKAMTKGYPNSARGLTKAILNDPLLEMDEKFETLQGMCKKTTALWGALETGQEGVVREFTEEILETDQLDSHYKAQLLKAVGYGESGILRAMLKGRMDALTALLEPTINSPHLSVEEKVDILTDDSENFAPILNRAIYSRHKEVIPTTMQMILETDSLPSATKLSLIDGSNRYGQSIIDMAVILREFDALAGIVKVIIDTPHLALNEKVSLFQQINHSIDESEESEESTDDESVENSDAYIHQELVKTILTLLVNNQNMNTIDELDLLAAIDETGLSTLSYLDIN